MNPTYRKDGPSSVGSQAGLNGKETGLVCSARGSKSSTSLQQLTRLGHCCLGCPFRRLSRRGAEKEATGSVGWLVADSMGGAGQAHCGMFRSRLDWLDRCSFRSTLLSLLQIVNINAETVNKD